MSAQSDSAQVTPPSVDHKPAAILRFPHISLTMWYRIAELAYGRGMLPATKYRLARFLSQQELDPATGRVVGQWGTGRTDGGMTLAARYAWQFGVGEDRFWDDLKGLYRYGFAARVVAPAPGRRAVYALVLRADAILQDLPDDLARQLKVWDLPEFEDPYEDARYGHLTDDAGAAVLSGEPAVVAVDERGAAELDAAPRWEHPADSPAAAAAEAIRSSAKALGKDAGPQDLRCWAVADRDRAEALNQRLLANGKTSPLNARGVSLLSGVLSTGSRGLSWSNEMGQAKTTPSAAPGKKSAFLFGDDPSAVADRVLKRAWHAWRAQLGHGKVLLPSGHWDESGRWQRASAWTDLQRTVRIALRRSTESELVEVLSGSVHGVDDVGRLAAWRLWQLINARKNAHGYGGRRRTVAQADHVTRWDHTPTAVAERARIMATQAAPADLRDRQAELLEQERRREAARIAAEAELAREAERAELTGRWGLDRYAPVRRPEPEQPRRWASREPEHVHDAQMEDRRRLDMPLTRSQAEESHRAALARARAEKRNRRRG
ncbi:hypothetical protein RM863_37530 [Streptomyces sp. DSM 41014]|uniref:Uncharacterized protein n=2 Tax=Streptomyces TaxID=1883 RepID=A0ABU2UX22_9ACTN|nr:hypothetical protein [Streptomyces sp. DSM 41014]MDT0477836.1 hypothetical protein [Streptomyces sp. DSM 41014]